MCTDRDEPLKHTRSVCDVVLIGQLRKKLAHFVQVGRVGFLACFCKSRKDGEQHGNAQQKGKDGFEQFFHDILLKGYCSWL